jgi:hypothetical protein
VTLAASDRILSFWYAVNVEGASVTARLCLLGEDVLKLSMAGLSPESQPASKENLRSREILADTFFLASIIRNPHFIILEILLPMLLLHPIFLQDSGPAAFATSMTASAGRRNCSSRLGAKPSTDRISCGVPQPWLSFGAADSLSADTGLTRVDATDFSRNRGDPALL